MYPLAWIDLWLANYTDLLMQTMIAFFGCLVPVFIYNAHAYATSLFHTDYWNYQRLVIFLDEFLAVITGCIVVDFLFRYFNRYDMDRFIIV